MMIKKIRAGKILDSRRNPTIEVILTTNRGRFKASVPSGASTGKYEAKPIDALKAIKNVNEIIGPKLKGKNPVNQREIDNIMIDLDGTEDKSKLGANAILGLSMAVCRAGAVASKLSLYQYISTIYGLRITDYGLPRPCFNIINGGAHADNNLDIQEFMVIPDQGSFSQNLEAGKRIYKNLKNILKKEFGKKGIKKGDEGGFSPPISKIRKALDLLVQAIKDYPKTKIGLDCAASRFFLPSYQSAKGGFGSEGEREKYNLEKEKLSGDDILFFYNDLIEDYPIILIEDAFSEEDWDSWQTAGQQPQIMNNILLIGDDLTVTSKKRVKRAIDLGCLKGVIIKPNQVGTITETLETVKIARQGGLKIIVSHRSGETKDDFIADLAVGVGADFIKSGAPGPKERMTKYKRLMRIERIINNK